MKNRIVSSLLVVATTLSLGFEAQAQGGWTPATRGTVIGAGVGGAAGAILNKRNRVVGAVVGGTVGAVAGKQVGKRPVRRWSPQAKGAVIGAGTGAAAGAIIHKRNRALGGVVGGVVAGAGGYVVGKKIDNRNKRRAAEAEAAAARAEAERMAAAKTAQTPTSGTGTSAIGAPTASVPAAVPATALAAYAPQAQVTPGVPSNASAFGFLLNPSFGDYSTPYPTSEYRRKSW